MIAFLSLSDITSGIISGTASGITLAVLIWFYNTKFRPKIKITSSGSTSNSGFCANSINIDIQNNANKLLPIKRLKLINKKSKFIKYIDIKNFYLDDSKTPYNKTYYHLPQDTILQLKFYYTKGTGLLELTNKLTVTVDNDGVYLDNSALKMLEFLSGKIFILSKLKRLKLFKKEKKYKYVETSLTYLIIENVDSNIRNYYPLKSSVIYILYNLEFKQALAISVFNIYNIKTGNYVDKDVYFTNLILLTVENKINYKGNDYFIHKITHSDTYTQSEHILIESALKYYFI